MPFRLWDQIRDWVILLVLVLVSVVAMLAQNEPMLRGLRGFALETTSRVEARFAWVGHFFRALDDSEILLEENIELSSQVARSREARIENERLRALLALQDSSAYPMVAARIITKDIFRQENFLTLDVGRRDSVDVGMAVVDEQGILGKIVFVSENYSRVMPYLNTDFRVPAKVQPLQAAGIARWTGTRADDALLLEHIVKTEPVEVGQLVVTSGFSGVFPPGLPVGTVEAVQGKAGRNELEILVTPASSLRTAEHAFVLQIRPDPERLELEEERIR